MLGSKNFNSVFEVEEYLAVLNADSEGDWRLPTKDELFELYNLFDLKKNGDIALKLEGNYWISTEKDEMIPATWEIGDQCEPERFFYEKQFGRVRAVRP